MAATRHTNVLHYGGQMNDFHFDELVLGGSLTALLYAYKKNLPILIDVAHIPFILEEVPSHWDLSFLGFSKGGLHKKSQVWDRLSFLLAMAGLVIFPNNIPNLNHSLLKGVKIFEFIKPKIKKIKDITKDHIVIPPS